MRTEIHVFLTAFFFFFGIKEQTLSSTENRKALQNGKYWMPEFMPTPPGCLHPAISIDRKWSLKFKMNDHLYLVSMYNSLQTLMDLWRYWKRYKCILLIDDASGLIGVDVKTILMKRYIESRVEIVNSSSNFEVLLRPALNDSLQNIVVICNEENTNNVLLQASIMDFFKTSTSWTVFSLSIPMQVFSMRISANCLFVLIAPIESMDIAQRISPNVKPKYIISEFWNFHFTRDQKLAFHFSLQMSFGIFDIFFSNKTKRVESIQFATWSVSQKLRMFETLAVKDKKQKLRGRTLRTSGYEHLPYVAFPVTNGVESIEGQNADIFRLLMWSLDLNFTYFVMENGMWGSEVNGTFNGAIGIVHRREADISLNVFGITAIRFKAVRYLGIIGRIDLCIAYIEPDPIVPSTTYILPFSESVWLCTIVAFFSVVFLLAIIKIYSPSWRMFMTEPGGKLHSMSFQIVTGSFFQEVLNNPPGISAKLIYITILIGSTALCINYSTIFTSFLAYKEIKLPITTVQDLAFTNDYTVGVILNSVQSEFFYRSDDPTIRLIKKKLLTNPSATAADFRDGVRKIYAGNYVLAGHGSSIIGTMHNNCSILVLPTRRLDDWMYMTGRYDFPYDRLFYIRLVKIMEMGILNRLARKYLTSKRPPCPAKEISLTLGMAQAKGVFYIFCFGLMLSLIVFIFEKIIYTLNYTSKH